MPSINASSMFQKVTSEFSLRSLAQKDPTKFNATIIEISDQQSRDKEYEKGLTWIRTYIGSLQAKLNATVEELNTLYETMLTDTMYKRADTRNTSQVMNAVEFALLDTCMPSKEITPLSKYVRNYQYNPLYGAKGVDLNNMFQSNQNASVDTARVNYESQDAAHHELGASAFGTLNYLWQWDVDRINASYATTMDMYVGDDGILYVKPGSSLINGTTIKADPNLSVIGDANKVQVNVTALQPNRGVFYPDTETDPSTVDHLLYETFESDSALKTVNAKYDITKMDDCKWTQSYTNPYDRSLDQMSEYLQWGIAHNRGSGSGSSIHFGDPSHENYLYEYYVIKDTVEKDTVTNYPISPSPSPILLPTGEIDQPIAQLEQDYGTSYTTQTNGSTNIEKVRVGTNVITGDNVTAPAGSKSYIENTLVPGVSANANNFTYAATSTSHFNQKSNADERDDGDLFVIRGDSSGNTTTTTYKEAGGISAKWRLSTNTSAGANSGGNISYSGTDSYYFGNNTGQGYGADRGVLSPVADTYTITMVWENEGSYYYVDVLGIPGLITQYEPDFDLHVYGDNGVGGIGAELGGVNRNNPVRYHEDHALYSQTTYTTDDGTETHTLSGPSGKRFVKIELNGSDGWLAPMVEFNVGAKLTPVGRNAGNEVQITPGGVNDWDGVTMVDFTIGIDWSDTWVPYPTGVSTANRDWWGNGYYGGPTAVGSNVQGSGKVKSSEGDVSGFQIDFFNPYIPKGDLTRKVDLTEMKGPDADFGLGFERLELRYKQNFVTESEDPGSKDRKIIEESTNNGATWNAVSTETRVNQNQNPHVDPFGLETVNGNVWESKVVQLDTSKNWNTESKQINFKFDAGDQYYNDTKGWNVDNVEVVARGESKGELISPKMDLSKYTTATLKYDSRFGSGQSTYAELNANKGVTFDTAGSIGSQKDLGDVASTYYSIDGGVTWKVLPGLIKQGQEKDALGQVVNAEGTAYDQSWINVEADLTCAAGQSDVRIKYVFTTNADNNAGDGWNIDNVDVFGKKSASTDFYMYKETLDANFVQGTANSAEVANSNRPNISFDPRGTNTLGRYTIDNGRVTISNTDTPMFANTLLTYVEQSTANYNTKKIDHNAVWNGDDAGPMLVVNKYGTITNTLDTNFTPDSLGRLFNGEGNMYIDEAMAINLGLAKGIVPTMEQIGAKQTGWVNYDKTDEGLKFIAGTCFDEADKESYATLTTYHKNTVFANGAQAASITIETDEHAFFYVNGVLQTPVSTTGTAVAGKVSRTYNFNLADGVNTVAIQATEVFDTVTTNPAYEEFVRVTAGSANLSGILSPTPNATTGNLMDERWATSVYTGGYKIQTPTSPATANIPVPLGYVPPSPGTVTIDKDGATPEKITGVGTKFLSTFQIGQTIQVGGEIRRIATINSETDMTVTEGFSLDHNASTYAPANLLEADQKEVFGQIVDKKKNVQLNFNNIDKNGTGILSQIMAVEVVATGEPTIQSYVTELYSSKVQTDTGTLMTRLDYGYYNGIEQNGTAKEAFNLTPTNNLNYKTDSSGKATVSVLMNNSQALANDASLLMKVSYIEDTDMDGVISAAEAAIVKFKYIGNEDTRDKSYYRGKGTVSVAAGGTTITGVGTDFTKSYHIGDTIKIGTELRTIKTISSDTVMSTAALTPFSSNHTNSVYNGDVIPLSNNVANGVVDRFAMSTSGAILAMNSSDKLANTAYNNLLVASKGRSGGSDVDGNENIFTKRIKQILDGEAFQEMLKYNLLDNIYVAATVSDNKGDQITGKLILDWDWRRRRVNVTQGSFSAIFKA